MERIITTNSNKVVINGINLGYLPRIRNPKNGQFVAWDVAKVDKMVDLVILKSCFLGIDTHFHEIEIPIIKEVESLIKERVLLIQAHEKTPDMLLPECQVDNTICQFYCDARGFCTFDDIEF